VSWNSTDCGPLRPSRWRPNFVLSYAIDRYRRQRRAGGDRRFDANSFARQIAGPRPALNICTLARRAFGNRLWREVRHERVVAAQGLGSILKCDPKMRSLLAMTILNPDDCKRMGGMIEPAALREPIRQSTNRFRFDGRVCIQQARADVMSRRGTLKSSAISRFDFF
jgi:hypothetical protein